VPDLTQFQVDLVGMDHGPATVLPAIVSEDMDPQEVRSAVFGLIERQITNIRIPALILDKKDVYPDLRQDKWLYKRLYYYLIRSVLTRGGWAEGSVGIQLLIDHTEDSSLREETVSGIRWAESEANLSFKIGISHTSSFGHPFLQLADYCAWAIYQKYEREDLRSYQRIEKAIENEWQLFKSDPPG